MKRKGLHIGILTVHALTIFGLWIVGGIVLTGFELWRLDIFGRYETDFPDFVPFGILRGVVWALVTPLVIWTALRFPVQKPRRLQAILLLVPIVLLLALFREALGATLAQLVMGMPWDPREIVGAWNLRIDVNAAVIIGIIAGSNLVKVQRENAERQRRVAELQSEVMRAQLNQLRADLEPHFLFNSLHGIASLVHANPKRAERMLIALSGLLRRTLEMGAVSRIHLSEELQMVNEYLELAGMRFGEKLVFRIDAEDEILDAGVPPLLLQPLVENAIRHGPLADGADARVEIVAFANRESLRVQVRDNGPGCDPADAFVRGGVGLANTRRRLELLYGDGGSLELRRESGAFVVDLTFPLQRDAEAVA